MNILRADIKPQSQGLISSERRMKGHHYPMVQGKVAACRHYSTPDHIASYNCCRWGQQCSQMYPSKCIASQEKTDGWALFWLAFASRCLDHSQSLSLINLRSTGACTVLRSMCGNTEIDKISQYLSCNRTSCEVGSDNDSKYLQWYRMFSCTLLDTDGFFFMLYEHSPWQSAGTP